MIEYLSYPACPVFEQTPNGILTTFTVDAATPFVENTLVITHGGMIWQGFTYTDNTTVEFDVAPPIDTEISILSGFFGIGAITGTYSEYLTQLATLLQDIDDVLTSGERVTCLVEAVQEYSTHFNDMAVEDTVGDNTYILDLPDDWDDVFSEILSIEEITEPDTDDEKIIVLVPETDYKLYHSDTTTTVIYGASRFSTSYTYRVKYTIPYTFTPSVVTIPAKDQQAIVYLAASQGCLALSARLIHSLDQTFDQTVMHRKSQAQEYRELAKLYLSHWKALIGLPEKPITPAAYTSVNWNYVDSRRVLH